MKFLKFIFQNKTLLIFSLSVGMLASAFHFWKAAQQPKQVYLNMDVTSAEHGVAQLFWDTGSGFSENDSLALSVVPSKNGLKMRFLLPESPIHKLRLDPTTTAEPVTIRNLRIESLNGKKLLSIDPSQVVAYELFSEIRSNRNGLEIHALPRDGNVDSQVWFDLQYPLQVIYDATVYITDAMFFGLLSGVIAWILLLLAKRMISGWSVHFKTPETRRETLFLSLLGTLFFLSGFVALLYQVAWQRTLGLFCGSDVGSITVVVTAYLVGLGIGSFLGAYHSDRVSGKQAIRIYALLNLGIAAFAMVSPFIFYDLLFLKLGTLSTSPALMMLIVLLSLMVPTTLMGLSLPFISRGVVKDLGAAAGTISIFNGLNTIGAAMGALIGGWYLVGTLGFTNAVYLGSVLSALVGICAWIIANRSKEDTALQMERPSRESLQLRNVPLPIWNWCGLVLAAGFLAISLEMVWFRVLDVSLRSNAYTFSYLLFWFLIGDGLGSLIGASLVKRIRNALAWLLALQGLLVAYSLASIYLVHVLAQFSPFLDFILDKGESTSVISLDPQTVVVYLFLPLLIILPPSIVIGLNFPIMQKAVQDDAKLIGQRVSLLQAANIGGNSAAGLLSGLVLLHFFGTDHTLRILGGIGCIFLLVLVFHWFRAKRILYAVITKMALIALIAGIFLFPNKSQFWALLHAEPRSAAFDVSEDASGVSALRIQQNKTIIYAGGRAQGHVPFLSIHPYIGALPSLIHENPKESLVIGLGSGGTAYGTGVNPKTESILVVEIMSSQIPLMRRYAQSKRNEALSGMIEDPRFQFIEGDGRRFLATTKRRFDIIEADAIVPVSSGSGFLYSAEYFEQARSRLKPGGLMAQWKATHRVGATFVSVFPYVLNFGNHILIGSNDPIPFDLERLKERLNAPEISNYLTLGNIDPSLFLYLLQTRWPLVDSWTPERVRHDKDINTDLWPKDEYYLNN